MGETREIPYSDVDIAAVRRYATARANESSVRQIARQVPMRHSTFDKFLRGSEPLARTRILVAIPFVDIRQEAPSETRWSVRASTGARNRRY